MRTKLTTLSSLMRSAKTEGKHHIGNRELIDTAKFQTREKKIQV